MAKFNTAEEAVNTLLEAMRYLEERPKGERPIPIVRDRDGKLAKDYTAKDWILKIHEEVLELENECLSVYMLDDVPGRQMPTSIENKRMIADELCDVIKVLYSMAYQMGIDADYLEDKMHENNEKTTARGYHNDK